MHRWHSCLSMAALAAALAHPAVAHEPAVKPRPPAAGQQARLDFFLQRMKDLRLINPAAPTQPLLFAETPLLTFENPVSSIVDGFMFVWTDRGRPVAVMKSYYNAPNKTWGRTFVSLAEFPIHLESAGAKLWTPQQAGVSFSPFPEAPRPADQPKSRLVQMRHLAEQLAVIDHWGLKEPTDWRLRLLTTPLLRYESPEQDVVDGALFGYVLTTSPEALVMLEARKQNDELTWHFAVSRFTRFGITFSLGDKQVAEFPRLEAWPPSGTYFHSPIPIADYPFQAKEQTADPKR